MNTVNNNHYDVIVIGGGITGAGTARDCAMRGLKVLLVERHDYSTGATGRNHGLLHSGARYAVTDHESATECIKENMILDEELLSGGAAIGRWEFIPTAEASDRIEDDMMLLFGK